MAFGMEIDMTDNRQSEALRLAEQYDYGDPVAHSNTWKAAVCNELRRMHAVKAPDGAECANCINEAKAKGEPS